MTKNWPILDNFWSFLENFWSVLKILVSAENFGLGIFQNLAFYRVAEQKCILNPRAGPPRGPLFGPFLGPLFGSLRSAPIQNHRRTSYQFDGTASDPPKRGSQNGPFLGTPTLGPTPIPRGPDPHPVGTHTENLSLYTGNLSLYTGNLSLYTGNPSLYTGNLSLYTGNLSLYTGVKEDLCLRIDPFWGSQETKERSQDKVPKSGPGPFGLISNPEQKSPESSRARARAHARARARARGSTKSYLISHIVLDHSGPVFCLFSFHPVLARFWDTPNT